MMTCIIQSQTTFLQHMSYAGRSSRNFSIFPVKRPSYLVLRVELPSLGGRVFFFTRRWRLRGFGEGPVAEPVPKFTTYQKWPKKSRSQKLTVRIL